MDDIDTSESTWKGKVIRYRKWEQRHDRTVNPEARKNYARTLAEFYVDLSNTARAIVQRVTKENGARWTDNYKPLRDETWTSVFGSSRYTLKRKHDEPGRVWFQRFEHEPWFDLGYWHDKEGVFMDWPDDVPITTRASERAARIAQNRALDIQRSPFMGTNYAIQAQAAVNNAVRDQIHIDLERTNKDMYERPEDLEAAAAHAMARAAELRAIDDREPTGEEATISWTWADEYEGAKTYTFVAFRTDDGVWYATGNRICRDGVKWRELALGKFGKALREGTFFLVTEWSQIGGE